jgi:hypothetical protein
MGNRRGLLTASTSTPKAAAPTVPVRIGVVSVVVTRSEVGAVTVTGTLNATSYTQTAGVLTDNGAVTAFLNSFLRGNRDLEDRRSESTAQVWLLRPKSLSTGRYLS